MSGDIERVLFVGPNTPATNLGFDLLLYFSEILQANLVDSKLIWKVKAFL